MRENIDFETSEKYKEKLRIKVRKELEKDLLSQMDNVSKFYHLNIVNNYKKHSLINNKLFKSDEKTEEAKKIIDYIYSGFNKENFNVEKNSDIYYNEKTNLIFDVAAKEKSKYVENPKDRLIFACPNFMCDISLSERTRAQYLKNIKFNNENLNTYWIIDLKAKLLLSFENKRLSYSKHDCKIITKDTGKFKMMGIEFDSKLLF